MSTVHAPALPWEAFKPLDPDIELPIKYWDNAAEYCSEVIVAPPLSLQSQVSNAHVAIEKLAYIQVLRDDSQLYRDYTQREPTLRIKYSPRRGTGIEQHTDSYR